VDPGAKSTADIVREAGTTAELGRQLREN